MATLYITEFADLGNMGSGQPAQVGKEPSNGTQTVALGASSTQSAAFKNNTRFLRLFTDTVCGIEFSTNPTAVAGSRRMAANQTEYYQVPLQGLFKVAAITP